MLFDGLTGEVIDNSVLRVYTLDRQHAYSFYSAWRRSLGKTPVSSNALTMLEFTDHLDLLLEQ